MSKYLHRRVNGIDISRVKMREPGLFRRSFMFFTRGVFLVSGQDCSEPPGKIECLQCPVQGFINIVVCRFGHHFHSADVAHVDHDDVPPGHFCT
jgi:hypothetical protein